MLPNYKLYMLPVFFLIIQGCLASKSPVSPRFNHIVVLVSDMERSVDFYTKAFNLEVTKEIDSVTYVIQGKEVERVLDVHLLKFKDHDFVLELVGVDSGNPAAIPMHIHHVGVDVKDIEAAARRVVAAGAQTVRPIEEVRMKGLVVKHCFFKGPDGEILELMQILEGAY